MGYTYEHIYIFILVFVFALFLVPNIAFVSSIQSLLLSSEVHVVHVVIFSVFTFLVLCEGVRYDFRIL